MRKLILIGALIFGAFPARADERCRQLEQLASVAHTFTAAQQRQGRVWYNRNCSGNTKSRAAVKRQR